MKKFFLAFFVLLLAPVMASAAQAEEKPDSHVTGGQALISLTQKFMEEEVLWKGSMFANATLFMDTNSSVPNSSVLFVYLGPMFQLSENTEIEILTGTRNDASGMYAIAAVWAYNSSGKISSSLAIDWYTPLEGEAVNKLWIHTKNFYAFSDSAKIGLETEFLMLNDSGEFLSACVGPSLAAGNLSIWGFFNSMPSNKEQDGIFVRVTYKVPALK